MVIDLNCHTIIIRIKDRKHVDTVSDDTYDAIMLYIIQSELLDVRIHINSSYKVINKMMQSMRNFGMTVSEKKSVIDCGEFTHHGGINFNECDIPTHELDKTVHRVSFRLFASDLIKLHITIHHGYIKFDHGH